MRRLSYSALALFERCSYRYYAERVLGLPPRIPARSSNGEPAALAPTELGDSVHRLLELVPLDDPVGPTRDALDDTVRGWYPDATSAELERIAELVDAYCVSDLAKRVAGLPGARPERPFTFEQDSVLLRGRLDVLWQDGERALVVDYKSNALEGREPHEIVEAEYVLQRLVYALVCSAPARTRSRSRTSSSSARRMSSPRRSRMVTPLSSRPSSPPRSRGYAQGTRPTPSEFVCSDCPALDLVCAGPRLAFGG